MTVLAVPDFPSDTPEADHPRLPANLTTQLAQLFSAGFSLLPLGGSDGKKPIVLFKGRERLPLSVVVNRMAGAGSQTYGIRLGGLLVIDVDTDTPEARAYVERRFGDSPARTQTGRGYHLYFRHNGERVPRAVRLPDIKIDFKAGPNAFVVGPLSVRPDGTQYQACGPFVGLDALPEFRDLEGTSANALQFTDAEAHLPAGDQVYRQGTRHNALKRQAFNLVRSATSYQSFVADLKLFRDSRIVRPADFDDDHVERLASWFWQKRDAGELWGGDHSTFSVSRRAADDLIRCGETVALMLYLLLESSHGHRLDAEFAIVPDAIIASKRIKAGRRQLYAAIGELLQRKLIARIDRPRGKRDPHQYRLCRQAEREGERSTLTLVSSPDTQDSSSLEGVAA